MMSVFEKASAVLNDTLDEASDSRLAMDSALRSVRATSVRHCCMLRPLRLCSISAPSPVLGRPGELGALADLPSLDGSSTVTRTWDGVSAMSSRLIAIGVLRVAQFRSPSVGPAGAL